MPFIPPAFSWHLFDLACFSDEHIDQPGIYVAAGVPGDDALERQIVLFESVDEGASYAEVARFTVNATMGYANTTVSTTALPGLWDDASEAIVYLTSGELESVSDIDCQNGANRAILGNEVIGFANAELIDYRTYSLTRLLRGLQGTEEEIARHYQGDRFVVMSRPGIIFVPCNQAAFGQPRLYKAVPVGGRITDYSAITINQLGGTVRPLAPANVGVTRNASNDATISCTRRGRGVGRLFSMAPIRTGLDRAVTYFDVMDSVDPTVRVRQKITVSDSDTVDADYTAAEQTTDGYTPGDPINLQIYQYSSWLGTGAVATHTG